MSAFHYNAIDQSGKTQKGLIQGDTLKQARQALRQRGLTILEISEVEERRNHKKRKTVKTPGHRFRMNTADLSLITRQLATLLSAAMPLDEALQAVSEQSEKTKVKAIMLAIRARVLEGYSLAKSFAEFPRSFSNLYCATVAAGEQTGHLDAVLERLADYAEKQQYMKRKVQQALIYPCIMTVVSIFIVVFLLLYVVPKMIQVFNNIGQALPAMTIWLINISHFIHYYGLYVLLALIALGVGFHYSLKRYAFRKRFHHFLLGCPGIRHFIKLNNTARFIHTFGVLLSAGMPAIEAMKISANLITNIPIHDSVEKATQNVSEGANIHLSLKNTQYFQAMTVHLIASGEASGQLEQMLARAADNQDQNIEQMINTTLTLFEPLMILVMGAIVLFIVLAVLLPIFSLDQFGN